MYITCGIHDILANRKHNEYRTEIVHSTRTLGNCVTKHNQWPRSRCSKSKSLAALCNELFRRLFSRFQAEKNIRCPRVRFLQWQTNSNDHLDLSKNPLADVAAHSSSASNGTKAHSSDSDNASQRSHKHIRSLDVMHFTEARIYAGVIKVYSYTHNATEPQASLPISTTLFSLSFAKLTDDGT